MPVASESTGHCEQRVSPGLLLLLAVLIQAAVAIKQCPVGTYDVDHGCVSCPIGTFSNAPGASSCTDCDHGRHTEGLTGQSQCVNCPKGRATVGSPPRCVGCGEGGEKPVRGTEPCAPCKAGKWNDLDAASNCDTCHIMQSCLKLKHRKAACRWACMSDAADAKFGLDPWGVTRAPTPPPSEGAAFTEMNAKHSQDHDAFGNTMKDISKLKLQEAFGIDPDDEWMARSAHLHPQLEHELEHGGGKFFKLSLAQITDSFLTDDLEAFWEYKYREQALLVGPFWKSKSALVNARSQAWGRRLGLEGMLSAILGLQDCGHSQGHFIANSYCQSDAAACTMENYADHVWTVRDSCHSGTFHGIGPLRTATFIRIHI